MQSSTQVTPQKIRKKVDGRTSEERGIRKVREKDFKTPPRPQDHLDPASSTAEIVLDAPRKSRQRSSSPSPHSSLPFRFHDFNEDDKDFVDTKLANLLTTCARVD